MQLLLTGLVPASGLGDALQYSVSAFLILKSFPHVKLDLAIPDAQPGHCHLLPTLLTEKRIRLISGLQDQSLPFPINILKDVKGRARLKSRNDKRLYLHAPQHERPHSNMLKILARVIFEKYCTSHISVFYIRPSLCRFLNGLKFDGGFIGGHTITVPIFDYMIVYNCAKAITKGPLITFPISTSAIALRRHTKHLNMIKKSLNLLDAVFVRGKYSFKMLTRFVDKNRVFMALDSGFGVKLVYKDPAKAYKKTREYVIGIVPRRDYFASYRLKEVYVEYLKALKYLLEGFSNNFDSEILLMPHAIPSDEYTISDLMKILNSNVKKCVKVMRPFNVLDSIKIVNSCDVLITSRMHAGIIALAYGKPTVFFMPKEDTKVLDVLSYLGLDEELYMIDSFDPREYEKLFQSVKQVLEDLTQEANAVKKCVDKHVLDVEKPIKLMQKLLA